MSNNTEAKKAGTKTTQSSVSNHVQSEEKTASKEAIGEQVETTPQDANMQSEVTPPNHHEILDTTDSKTERAPLEPESHAKRDQSVPPASTEAAEEEAIHSTEESHEPHPIPTAAEPACRAESERTDDTMTNTNISTITNTNTSSTITNTVASTTTTASNVSNTATITTADPTEPHLTQEVAVCSRGVTSGLLLASVVCACMAHVYAAALMLGVGALAFALAVFEVNLRGRQVLLRGGAGGAVVAGVLAKWPGVLDVLARDLFMFAKNWVFGE